MKKATSGPMPAPESKIGIVLRVLSPGSPPDVAKTKDRGLTSTQVVAYTNDNTMARLHTETIPTSTLAATARVVDGFVTTQTDHQGITGSFTRANPSAMRRTLALLLLYFCLYVILIFE